MGVGGSPAGFLRCLCGISQQERWDCWGMGGGPARDEMLPPGTRLDPAPSSRFSAAHGGGHPSRTLLAARPEQPPGEGGGGKASRFFPGSPDPANIWPRTSARSLCRRAPGRPRTHLPPPAASAPSVRRSPGRFPAPPPPPAGLGSHGSSAGSRAAHLSGAAGPAAGRPQGEGQCAQECLSDGCAPRTKPGVRGRSPPGRAQSQSRAALAKGTRRSPRCPPGSSASLPAAPAPPRPPTPSRRFPCAPLRLWPADL